MTDEKFIYTQDLREKKSTARSARYKRTHAGKGGAVKFPSDYLSKKELNAMNGEVKSYRLNEPMTWAEYKSMPDDIRIVYIKALRDAYNVSDSSIAAMLGTGQKTFSNETRRLGIGLGRGKKPCGFKKAEWYAWLNRVPAPAFVDTVAPPAEDSTSEIAEQKNESPKPAVPCTGSMTFMCPANQALDTVAQLLGEQMVCISVSWNVQQAVNLDGVE